MLKVMPAISNKLRTTRLKPSSAAASHAGHVRPVNEDSHYSDVRQGIWAVADGIGGFAAGDVASQTIVSALHDIPYTATLPERVEEVKAALRRANQTCLSELTFPPQCSVMGSTAVVMLLDAEAKKAACVWVGDSRLYALRGEKFYQLTKDHSLVQDLIDNGMLSEDEREGHPKKHVITRAIGVHEDLDIDVVFFDVLANDIFVLCSDGLHGELSPVDIADCLQRPALNVSSAEQHSKWVVRTLLNAVLETKASDNVTINAVVISDANG